VLNTNPSHKKMDQSYTSTTNVSDYISTRLRPASCDAEKTNITWFYVNEYYTTLHTYIHTK